MKPIPIFLFSCLLFLSSCYKDKGNYSYHELESVSIDTTHVGMQAEYAIMRFDTLTLSPRIWFEGQEVTDDSTAPLDYLWTIFSATSGSGASAVIDTIGHERVLHNVISRTGGNYLVQLVVTNRNDGTAVAPYMLRGLEPGSTSWNYTGNWTSATFQVTGFLANGRRDFASDDDWLPLRWFVFDKASFDENFETQIEVKDPYSQSSPGWTYGWKAWVDQYGYAPVFFKWSLRQRGSLIGTETLNPTNYYENAD